MLSHEMGKGALRKPWFKEGTSNQKSLGTPEL